MSFWTRARSTAPSSSSRGPSISVLRGRPSRPLEKWGHERILGDVVWVIRKYRPDVIILCFSRHSRDGHGQHQTSAILGKEAFDAAADPKTFPEQLKYVQPWQREAHRSAAAVLAAAAVGDRRAGADPASAEAAPPRPTAPAAPKPSGEAEPAPIIPFWLLVRRTRRPSAAVCITARAPAPCGVPAAAVTPFELVGGPSPPPRTFSTASIPRGIASRRRGGRRRFSPRRSARYEPAHPEKVLPFLVKARPLIATIEDPLAKVKLVETR